MFTSHTDRGGPTVLAVIAALDLWQPPIPLMLLGRHLHFGRAVRGVGAASIRMACHSQSAHAVGVLACRSLVPGVARRGQGRPSKLPTVWTMHDRLLRCCGFA